MEKGNKAYEPVRSVLYGIVLSLVIILLGSLLSTWLIHKEYTEMDSIGYLTMIVLSVSGISCGFIMKRKAKVKLLITAVVAEGCVFLCLLATGSLLFDGKIQGVWVTLLLLMGTMLAAILVGTNRKQRMKNHRHKVMYG